MRNDQELVCRAQKGDQAAFQALVERHQRKAFSVALGIVRDHDDALDICQEAFLRAFRGLASFDRESQFFTWLYRIVHNLAIDHLRKRRLSTVSLDDNVIPIIDASAHADPSRQVSQKQLCAGLDEALAALTPEHRAVLMLREVQGLSYKEIAEAIGCAVGTVMSRLFHARKKLLKALEANQGALDLAA